MEAAYSPHEVELVFEVDDIEIRSVLLENGLTNTAIIEFEEPGFEDLNHIEYVWPDGRHTLIFNSIPEQYDLIYYGWPKTTKQRPSPLVIDAYVRCESDSIDREIKEWQHKQPFNS